MRSPTPPALTAASSSPPRAFVLGNFVHACCWRVPRLPQPGETLQATAVHTEPGGKGLNVAVGLARLGAQVDTLIGCGTDAPGRDLLALLRRERIATRHVHRFAGGSGWGAGFIAADGHNAIAVHPGANALLGKAHVQRAEADLVRAQLVYGQFETALPAVQAAFATAHRRGIPTVLNPSPWRAPPAALRRSTHTLIVNQVEAMALLELATAPGPRQGTSALVAAVRTTLPALATAWPGLRCLVITLGAGGSLGFEREGNAWQGWHAPAPRVRAVDTVGAGDAFASGYCCAVLAGQPLPDALAWGNLCGAHVAAHAGVLAVLPGAHDLSAWVADARVPRVRRLRGA